MSRRSRHGRRPQTTATPQEPEAGPVADHQRGAVATASPASEGVAGADGSPVAPAQEALATPALPLNGSASAVTSPGSVTGPAASVDSLAAPAASDGRDAPLQARADTRPDARAEAEASAPGEGEGPRTTCTQAQLRRFIKSRPWIPMHELRRRFGIYGGDDDVTPVRVGTTTVFMGLPTPEGRMLGELLASGDVGYELSLDPGAPIVVGVYPMRPVPRG